MLQFKEGVQLTVTKAVNEILLKTELVFNHFNVPCTVTSGTDGKHGEHSKHYVCQALDFRRSNIKDELLAPLVQMLKQTFGKDYDIVLEVDHIHIEYDPKGVE